MLLANLAVTLLIGLYGGSSYRDQYPMPDLTVPTGWGVNVNIKDMDDDDINAIADAGAKWVRMDLLWARVEEKPGVYNFSKYDPVIDGFGRKGIRALLILDYGNKAYNVDAPRTDQDRSAFANFAAAAVKHYRHKGVIWEVWNEPNLSHFWAGQPNADEYAALVNAVVPAMRNVSSDEWIIGGASSRFDWKYLDECFSKGVLDHLDGVSIHPYRDQNAPESVVADWEQLRTMVSKYAGARHITLICSEWGYSTYSAGVSEREQGEFAEREYLANLSAGVPLTIWYAWRDRPEASSEKEQHFGMMDGNMRPKQAHDVMANLLGSLNGYSFDSRLNLGDDENVALLFRKGTDSKLATWTSQRDTQTVHLPAAAAWFASSNNRQIDLTGDVQILSQH